MKRRIEIPILKAMKRQKPFEIYLLLILCVSLLPASCGQGDALKRIMASGEITAVTRNNAHCYYTYRGAPMGFEYDLAKAFSDYLGVELKIVTPAWEKLFETLDSGTGDFAAAGISILPSREKLISFSDEYLSIRQKVILHKDNHLLKRLEDLHGATIHVRRGTSYEETLNQLSQDGLNINIKLEEDTPTEELIRMVADKRIEVTIADSSIALLNRRYYPDVRVAFPVEKPQSLGWAVKKGERALLKKINAFFKKIKEDGTFEKIYQKYYANVEVFDYVDLKKYHRRLETRLPRYERIIRKAAEEHGFDWRLIAAVIYQESHFDPGARSFTGVKGIMQLTRQTAREMGVKDRLDPEQSIMGGVKYLKRLYRKYDDAEDPDRLFITLASYNVGHGHILDARKIAGERNLDPDRWTSLEQTLPLLRYPKYYKKTKYGYCRGTEPVRHVNRIRAYYDILRRKEGVG